MNSYQKLKNKNKKLELRNNELLIDIFDILDGNTETINKYRSMSPWERPMKAITIEKMLDKYGGGLSASSFLELSIMGSDNSPCVE